MIRKEEDEVGLTATGVYLAFHTQTETCATSTQYNTVHKQHKGGLSWAKRVPSRQNRQSAVCPSLPASPSPVPLCGLSTSLTGTRQVFVICTWPTSPKSLSRCGPRWTTPLSPHTPTARLRPGSHPACSPPPFLERKSATAICTPGLWITWNLKGCKARYQRVIRALLSFMRWSHCRGAWSEQRVNSRPRR